MQTIGVLELADIASRRRGTQIVTIVARTTPDLVGGKKSPLAGRKVEKVATVNGMINWNYTNAVNNQRLRESKPLNENDEVEAFVAEPRKWGKRIQQSAFVRHIPKKENEKRVYLEQKVERSLGYQFYIDDVPVDASEVLPFVRESNSDRQGVDKKIILRDYRLSSIEYITMQGDTFKVEVTSDEESRLYDSLVPVEDDVSSVVPVEGEASA